MNIELIETSVGLSSDSWTKEKYNSYLCEKERGNLSPLEWFSVGEIIKKTIFIYEQC